VDTVFDDVSWIKNGDPIYALERKLANNPLSGHPALCAVSAELNTLLKSVRDSVIYDNTDPLAQLRDIQTRLQPELDKAASRN
jgi:multiple sugar transport system substrate-binding protein